MVIGATAEFGVLSYISANNERVVLRIESLSEAELKDREIASILPFVEDKTGSGKDKAIWKGKTKKKLFPN